ncbi:MAG: hypothetical protein ACP5IO_01325 [Elusimicrobiales bacterium]
MHTFNTIFTPFGIILVIFAVIFSQPEKKDTILSIATLTFQFVVNYYMSKNIYHFPKPQVLRKILVMFNIITTSVVFYLLQSYWAPVWLLYTMPSIFASTFLTTRQTILFSVISASLMLLAYYIKAFILDIELSPTIITMALCHSLFIIAVSVFVNTLCEAIVKIRKI